jgi:hypothetical protein
MVCAPSSLLFVAALAAMLPPQFTDASSITANPTTPIGVISKLNPKNPVFGGRPARDMVKPMVTVADTVLTRAQVFEDAARSGNATARRKLEATSADVQRLQDYFGTPMDTNANSIAQKYARASFDPSPWPSSYWPTFQDSINHRWTDDISPAEKYARAFGRDPTAFMNKVSAQLGIDSQADSSRVCTSDNQCDRFRDGSKCARRYGRASGYCVPGWYGICHAWAPAAILEDEPRCNVVKNGVTFRPFDIKGLMTAVYDGAEVPLVFTGARYDGGGSPRDEYGRYTDPFERDLGPGYFHIAVTNIMGRFRKSFIVDVAADAQVWNQPVRSYSTIQPIYMTPSQAAWTYFGVPRYPFNNNAKQIAYMEMQFRYINEMYQDGPLVSTGAVDEVTVDHKYTYLLELDDQQNIIGGEWLFDSQIEHPDFLWFVTAKPSMGTVTALDLSYNNVLDLLKQSVACGNPVTPPPGGNNGQCGNDQTGPQACPSGQYCQPWDPNFYQCRSLDAKCGKQEVNVDYYGDDIATHQLLLPEQCCDKCYETPGCRAYTFVNYNSDGKAYCYLKSGTGQRSSKVGAVSATITSPTTNPPTSPPGPAPGGACGNDQSGPQACPSGQYCQPWNPSFYQCRTIDAKCGKQEVAVDFYGDDIATFQLLLPEQCCDQCFATAGCKAYTFVNYNSDGKAYCYLKKGSGQRSAKVGAVSAMVRG